MKKPWLLLLLLPFVAVLVYFLLPSFAHKRLVRAALSQFEEAVATHDRAKIGEALSRLIADGAELRLDVKFVSIVDPNRPVVAQDFSKETFLPFIDNILYTLTDYSYESKLEKVTLAEDGKTASIVFTSKEWGDGTSYFAGVAMAHRYSSLETRCEGEVRFSENAVEMTKLDCFVPLMMVPKPGEINKIRDGQTMQQLLDPNPTPPAPNPSDSSAP